MGDRDSYGSLKLRNDITGKAPRRFVCPPVHTQPSASERRYLYRRAGVRRPSLDVFLSPEPQKAGPDTNTRSPGINEPS